MSIVQIVVLVGILAITAFFVWVLRDGDIILHKLNEEYEQAEREGREEEIPVVWGSSKQRALCKRGKGVRNGN